MVPFSMLLEANVRALVGNIKLPSDKSGDVDKLV